MATDMAAAREGEASEARRSLVPALELTGLGQDLVSIEPEAARALARNTHPAPARVQSASAREAQDELDSKHRREARLRAEVLDRKPITCFTSKVANMTNLTMPQSSFRLRGGYGLVPLRVV